MHHRRPALPRATTTIRAGRATLRFYQADAVELLRRLPAATVDVIVTSPPYNLGVDYRSYDDRLSRPAYLKWTGDWIGAAARVLGPHGSLFLNVGNKPTRPWTAIDVALEARQHLTLQNTIHWIKSIVIDQDLAGARAALSRDLAVGHYKPINSERFLNDCHEYVFHFTRDGRTPLDRRAIGVPYQDPSNIARWNAAASGLRCRGNTWFIPYQTIQSRERDRPHPATFPPRLPRYCLEIHSEPPRRLVMDPFLGLGSTAVACAELGLDFVGIEMDGDYLNEAVARTRDALKATRKKPRAASATTARRAKASRNRR